MFGLIISSLAQALASQAQESKDLGFAPISMPHSKMIFDDIHPMVDHLAQLPDEQRGSALLEQMGFKIDAVPRIQSSLQVLNTQSLSQAAYPTLTTIRHELAHRLDQLDHIQANAFNELNPAETTILTTLKEATRSRVIEEVTRLESALKIEGKSKKIVLKQTSTISGALPAVGEIVAFPYEPIPEGFLICDGREVSREDYPELFDAIGVSYGPGDAVNTFHLPDYRGMFLRAVDAGAETDPDADFRTDRGDGTTGDVVGTRGADSTKMPNHGFSISIQSSPHTHDVSLEGRHRHIISGQDNDANPRGSASNEVANVENYPNIFNRYSSYAGEHTHTVSGGAHSHVALISGGDMQTAPVNVAVVYAIRAKVFDFSEAFASHSDIVTLSTEISAAQNSIVEKNNARQADIATLNATISTTQDSILEKDHARQADIVTLNTTISTTQESILEKDNARQADIATLNATISTTQENILEKDQARQAEIATLNATINTAQNSILEKDDARQAEIATLNATLSTTQAALDLTQDSILEKDNARQSDITALNTTIQTAHRLLDQLETQQSSNITSFDNKIIEQAAMIEAVDYALKTSFQHLNETTFTLNNEIITQQTILQETQNNIVEKDDARQAEIATLNATLSTTQATLDLTQDSILEKDNARQTDITALNRTIQTAHRLLDQLETQQSSNVTFFDDKIMQQAAKIEAVNDTLKTGFQHLSSVVQGLNISNINATLNQLDATQSAAASNMIALTQMLSDLTKKLGDNTVDDLVSELKESKSLIETQNEMIQTLQKELEIIQKKDSGSLNDRLSTAAIALSSMAILGLMGVIFRQSLPAAGVLPRGSVINAQT